MGCFGWISLRCYLVLGDKPWLVLILKGFKVDVIPGYEPEMWALPVHMAKVVKSMRSAREPRSSNVVQARHAGWVKVFLKPCRANTSSTEKLRTASNYA